MSSFPLSARLRERILQNSLQPTAQTFLMEGAEEELRFELSQAFAAALLCQAPKDGACGRCPSCRYIEAETHADYKLLPEVRSDARIPVEHVRREVMADVLMAPQLGSRKVYQIDADKLNEQGQNALLKTLEEPPTGVFFILAVSSTEQLLPTLLSRSALISLAAQGGEAAGGPKPEDEDARRAQEQAQQEIRNFVLRLPERSMAQLLTDDVQWMDKYKKDAKRFHRHAKQVLRDLLVITVGEGDYADEETDYGLYTTYIRQHRPHPRSLTNQSRQLDEWLKRFDGNANYEMNSCALLLAWRKEYPYG